ncbi:MAG: hypothetical protein ABIJ34_07340 [archaeon]
MSWTKIADSSELIVFENDLSSHKFKIEARRIDNGWEVFKTKIEGTKSNLISEHLLENKHDALLLIDKLKEDKSEEPEKKTAPILSLKRVYKEEFTEKWFFTLDKDNFKNFVFIKYDNYIRADVVMHESYALKEKAIISQIEEKLGLKEFGEATLYEIYYFKRYNKTAEKKLNFPEMNFMDMEFDFSDEEYY